ncbi:nucleoside hydrolase-like domain-containing protein [Algoriphagus antarcticus]|uniref:Uncharacterized protein DUF1593 n=1 Tax=Algoriphagus antarcticus TaxID=238540 RepID=A0A3E0EB18_9BACT|nr:nucleoside hydrolase-like domain-containing protein [Algoriphagus antarcticus]REG94439.1 uncharacterized protein DUF1593 [Algoriphagus antarcticus]
MKNILAFLLCLFASFALAQTQLKFVEPVKQRVFVLTDITNEPDDQQSLVRFLVYSNEYDVEGIVATTSTHLRSQVRQDKIEVLIRDYGKVKKNLDIHDSGFPSMENLLSVTTKHLPLFSMEGVGAGKDSPGSELLIKAVDKMDERPLWVSVWGGANCLAQALWKVKNTRSEEDLKVFVDKIRVYTISDQDFAGPWIRQNFPGIFYIVDASAGDNWREYYKATWSGISGDRWYKNGPLYQFELVDNPWLKANIQENHGTLGANYLPLDYIMEGDTPSFIGLIQNGLAWDHSPAWGGWAGRYELWKSNGEVDKIWTSSINTQDEVTLSDGSLEASNQATIWRFRDAFQYDFAARMDWNVADTYQKANHNPVVVLNGNEGKGWASAQINEGEEVVLSAKGSDDPDGDQTQVKWWVYREAGNFTGNLVLFNPYGEEIKFQMPKLDAGQALHLILEVRDSGIPTLTSYRRVVLTNF